jgi:hypothetical protein
MTTTYQKRASARNNPQLNLLDWELPEKFRATNRAARKLSERYGISMHQAAALSAAAGLGEVSR